MLRRDWIIQRFDKGFELHAQSSVPHRGFQQVCGMVMYYLPESTVVGVQEGARRVAERCMGKLLWGQVTVDGGLHQGRALG